MILLLHLSAEDEEVFFALTVLYLDKEPIVNTLINVLFNYFISELQ